ncbi:MAG TPA: hypothetical protein PKW19_07180 [Dictyoglomaceae bacterium]|nr:hypothetical protein [Dictyoglomaceae bacterium]
MEKFLNRISIRSYEGGENLQIVFNLFLSSGLIPIIIWIDIVSPSPCAYKSASQSDESQLNKC